MEKYKKAAYYSFLVYLLYGAFVFITEYNDVSEHREWYVAGRLLFIVWGCFTLVGLRKNPYSPAINASIGVQIILYCAHGQYFNPYYIFGFHQVILGYAFLFPVPKRVFYSVLVFGTLLYLSVLWWRYEQTMEWFSQPHTPWDLVMAVIAVDLVAWLAYVFFTSDRTVREDLLRKFGVIGLQTATVVHDVKGILSTPRMYVDILKERLVDHKDPEVHRILQDMESQLLTATKMVSELNKISALQAARAELLSTKEVLCEVLDALHLKFRNIRVDIHGDCQIVAERAYLKTIFYNVLINAYENFRDKPHADPCIQVSFKKNMIEFEDNGGGFAPDVLAMLKKTEFHSNDGSGMGTFVIWDSMKQMNGSAEFTNNSLGAVVRLKFPVEK
ncbi:sensor histidine kinase [Bdellovibrio sp. HCB337]|uniref:sensor histidine kinase n=1 Tax=Bdellovibrio sp. HCB337 TaxID=3394358 RepID=UPI0039A613E4